MRLYLLLFFILAVAFIICNRPQPLLTDPRVKARAEIETQKILAKEPKESYDCEETKPVQNKKDDDYGIMDWYMSPANPAGPIGSMMFDD